MVTSAMKLKAYIFNTVLIISLRYIFTVSSSYKVNFYLSFFLFLYALILLEVVQMFEGKFRFCIIVIKEILISFISCSFFIFSVLYYIKVCLNNIIFILLFLVSLRLFQISYEFFCLALIFFFTHGSCLMLHTKFYVELWSLHQNSKTQCWKFPELH